MGFSKGRMKYLPSEVLREIDDIKAEHKIVKDNVAMRKMVDYTRVGRELERIRSLNFFGRKPTKRGRG